MDLGTNFTQFLIEEQRRHPDATGEFTELVVHLLTVAKVISREVNKAGLADVFGFTGHTNVHGEDVQKLDEVANTLIMRAAEHTGHLVGMASEELEEIYPIPDEHTRGSYVLLFDPVDGSSNIDVNVSIGTIFSIYRRKDDDGTAADLSEFLRKGSEQVVAGYIIYGSSTMLVYTTGRGVHGFTLDPSVGEFLLSHENIRIPERGSVYSVNEGSYWGWAPGVQRYIDHLKRPDSGQPYSARYVGSLVADFHRNLLKGGVFLYPAHVKAPEGKLRLLYEASPLAYIVEQAGGLASTGTSRVLDIQPSELHQRVPLVIGSREDVQEAVSYIKKSS